MLHFSFNGVIIEKDKGALKMPIGEIIFYIAEYIGIVAFAVSGALIAIDRHFDIFGVVVLAVTTALGGGTIRDIILGDTPPKMFYSYTYLLVATLCAFAVFLVEWILREWFLKERERIEKTINIFDAVGLGAFAVSGVQMALSTEFGGNAFLAVFLGTLTAIGGGVLRDMMSGEVPMVLKKRIYALAAIAGALTFYLLQSFVAEMVSLFVGMAVTITIRLCATHFKWSLPKL